MPLLSVFQLLCSLICSFTLSLSLSPFCFSKCLCSLLTFIFCSQSMQIEKDHNEGLYKWMQQCQQCLRVCLQIDGKLYPGKTSLSQAAVCIYTARLLRVSVDMNKIHFVVNIAALVFKLMVASSSTDSYCWQVKSCDKLSSWQDLRGAGTEWSLCDPSLTLPWQPTSLLTLSDQFSWLMALTKSPSTI